MKAKKIERKGWIIIVILAFVVIAAYVFYRVKKQGFLNHGLSSMVEKKTDGLYKVTYDSIYVNEADGNLYLKNLHVKGDTIRQMELVNNKDTNAAKAVFDIFIPMLEVRNFKTAKALLAKQMQCRQIIISNPAVLVYLFPGQGGQKDPNKQREELYKQILGNFKLIKADSISIINSEVTASDFISKEIKFHTYNTNIDLSDVAIDSTYNQDTSRTLFCKEIRVKTDRVVLGDKKNTSTATGILFDTRSKVVSVGSFEYDAFKNQGSFRTKVEDLSLSGMSWTGPVENSELIIDKAIIGKGNVESLVQKESDDKGSNKSKLILNGWIKTFSLNLLQVKSVSYTSLPVDTKSQPVTLKNNSFLIRNIRLDRESKLNSSLVNKAKEIEVSNNEISVTSGDKLYQYKLNGTRFNSKEKMLSIKSISVIPQLSEPLFARKSHYQTDRYDINFRNIVCSGIDIEKLLNGEIDVDNVRTSGNMVKVFRDLSYPIDSNRMVGSSKSFPHQLLHKLTIPLSIRRFTASNTSIEYKEKNPRSNSSGRVRFSNSNISIANISNEKSAEGRNITIDFNSSFLEKIPITGSFTFYNDQWRRGRFAVNANVDKSFDATIFNELTQPMSLARIEKGTISSFKFSMSADTLHANGNLVMPYEDLKVSLLKKKGDEYDKKGIFSLLANILVKNKNKPGDKLRTADVVYTRNHYKSFFNYIWMTIFMGMKNILVLKV